MKLFQYAVLLHPTEDGKKAGEKSRIIVEVASVLAKDEMGAVMLAAREIPEQFLASLDRVEVVVRPF